jgi:hypothetical protein
MFVRLSVRGEVDGVLSWADGEQRHSTTPVKLWEAAGNTVTGEPMFSGPELPTGNVLDVSEYRPDGTVHRTWWRLPGED